MTPDELAYELGVSPKTLRAWLRNSFPRRPDERGSTWELTPKQIRLARERWSGMGGRAETPREDPAVGSSRAASNASVRPLSDEHYVIDLCDEVLGGKSIRQAKFEWLRGDSGTLLPVDAFYPEHKLVVEYRERQHDGAVPFFDRRQTVSRVPRGQQRRLYDQRREDEIPRHGLHLLIIKPDQLAANARGRLIRNQETDLAVIRRLLL